MHSTSFHKLVTTSDPVSVKKLKTGKSGALVATYQGGIKAILKLAKRKMPNGKKTQRDLTVRSQPNREVAFYELSKMLGFDHLVPETVMTEYHGRRASAQLFVPAVTLAELEPKLKDGVGQSDWRDLVKKTCTIVPKRYWRQLLALDIIGGARDRHTNNVGLQLRMSDVGQPGIQPVFRLIAWDNATTFGQTFTKYHNVFHKLLFRKSVMFDDVWHILNKTSHEDLYKTLSPYIDDIEVDHAYMRMRFFLDYPYRLPWKVCSLGNDDSNAFPSYAEYFQNTDEEAPLLHTA